MYFHYYDSNKYSLLSSKPDYIKYSVYMMWELPQKGNINIGEIANWGIKTLRTGNLDETEEISEFSKELNRTFSWFDENFSHNTQTAASDFWNNTLSCRLVSVSENTNILAASDEYFVTQIRLNKEVSVVVRLSKQIVKTFLDETLGMSNSPFNIEKITELEARVLTEFNNFLYNNIEHMFLKGSQLPKNIYTYDECNLTYFLRNEKKSYGKLIISVPTMAITPEVLPPRAEPSFTLEDFPTCCGEVDIEVGSTRIKLNDLKQLESGDVVFLDRSMAGQMTLRLNNQKIPFNVIVDASIREEMDVEDENGGKPMNDIYNMWDTIQVEMGAEFEKVKLSLGELKQISEGLVVDIGSVYDNKIDLKVEDKIIASGELVIINDRYGVRVCEIFTEEKDTASNNAQIAQETYIEEPQIQEAEQVQMPPQSQDDDEFNEEDFDYSDFDVDEEDI